jgi:DegV family protein with EDD domain
MKIGIVLDSSCGLTQEEALKKGYHYVPLIIVENDDKIYKDGSNIKEEEVMSMLSDKSNKIKTSQANFMESLDYINELRNSYDRVIISSISKDLSGSYNQWKMIEQELGDNFLLVLDTQNLSIGNVVFAEEAKKMMLDNKSDEEIHHEIDNLKTKRYAVVRTNDIDRLVSGGRLSIVKGFLAKMLKINILIGFNGHLHYINKAKNVEDSVKQIKEYIYEKLQVNDEKEIKSVHIITYFKNNEDLENLKDVCNSYFLTAKTSFGKLPSIIACHVGLNSFAIYIEKK